MICLIENYGHGSNGSLALAYAVDGFGPVYENDFPFENVYNEDNNKSNEYFLADFNSVNLDINSRLRVKEASFLPSIYKNYEDNTLLNIYSSEKGRIEDEYNVDDIPYLRLKVKEKIKDNGAVIASIYADDTLTSGDNSETGFYNYENNAYFCNDISQNENHQVLIVGWDDTFSKSKFNNTPEGDGAYIVLNSYGTNFGDEGYFYVSYYDSFIESHIISIDEVKEYSEEPKDYDYLYQYDELGWSGSIKANSEMIYAANVFENKNNDNTKNEYLSEVGLYLHATEGVEIYVNTEDEDLTKGILVASYTGENALEPGYHTIKISPLKLTGEKFSVKVKYINQENAWLPLEINLKDSNVATNIDDSYYNKAKSNPNESYVSGSGTSWIDLYNLKINSKNINEEDIILKNTNACIKAFTTLGDKSMDVSVTGVRIDNDSIIMQEGEVRTLEATITPSNATNKNLEWSSLSESIAIVNQNGIVTAISPGTTEIQVKTKDGGYTYKCKVTVIKKTNTDDDIYKDEISGNDEVDAKSSDGDNTKATTNFPAAGSRMILISVILLIGIVVILIKKNKEYEDV